MITLEADIRQTSEKLDTLRSSGKMPAVFYGRKTESTPISVAKADFLKVWKEVGESGVVTIKTPKGQVEALIHMVDKHPATEEPIHADFYVFEKGKKIEVSVPISFVGVSPAVKDLGGSLVKVLHDLKLSADPQHIPHEIEVDISSLATFDSQILASDIVLPTGVELLELPTEVVASVAEPRADEPEEPAAPVDLSSIEVEKKGKVEEEGEAEAA